jgi:hypothetical protein
MASLYHHKDNDSTHGAGNGPAAKSLNHVNCPAD